MYKITKAEPLTPTRLREIAEERFGDMTKAVVDIRREVMLVDADLHSDQEQTLLRDGSHQSDLWGINLYPDEEGEDFIEFDSMINLRPNDNNRSRGVDDEDIRKKIRNVVDTLMQK
jgi:hypothetical protein